MDRDKSTVGKEDEGAIKEFGDLTCVIRNQIKKQAPTQILAAAQNQTSAQDQAFDPNLASAQNQASAQKLAYAQKQASAQNLPPTGHLGWQEGLTRYPSGLDQELRAQHLRARFNAVQQAEQRLAAELRKGNTTLTSRQHPAPTQDLSLRLPYIEPEWEEATLALPVMRVRTPPSRESSPEYLEGHHPYDNLDPNRSIQEQERLRAAPKPGAPKTEEQMAEQEAWARRDDEELAEVFVNAIGRGERKWR